MTQPLFVLSSCGTSSLTNGASDIERKTITRWTNAPTKETVESADRQILEARIAVVRETLRTAEKEQAGRMSAELKGILALSEGRPQRNADYHLLLCTDTWLGRTAADLAAEWLRERGENVTLHQQTGLRTQLLHEFQIGLSDLVQWCDEVTSGYRAAQYRIVFNLTGGFKSVQGFLQTLGMFYADEVVYIFESGEELLRIPRLPIQMVAEDRFRERLTDFRRLSLDLPIESVEGLPETLLTQFGGMVDLSPWGRLMWEQSRKAIYSERVWESPSSKLRYGKDFEGSVRGLPPDRCYNVNRKMEVLAQFLEKGEKYNTKALDFKALRGNPIPPSTHEIDAWSDLDARRCFGHYEAEGVFVIDRLDKALHKG